VVMYRSESSLSHGASYSTSASDADGMMVNGSSSLSSVVHEQPTGTTANSRPYSQPMKTRLDEIIANSRPDIRSAPVQNMRGYSPVRKRGLTLREAYMPSVHVTKRQARQSTTAADSHWWTNISSAQSHFTSRYRPSGVQHQSATARVNQSASPEPIHPSALKHQPYLYKLISETDQSRSAGTSHRVRQPLAAEPSTVVIGSTDYKPAKQYTAGHTFQPRKPTPPSDHALEPLPPPPSADELESLERQRRMDETYGMPASGSSRIQGSRVYTSPFITGAFLSASQSSRISHDTVTRPQLPVMMSRQAAARGW